MAGREHRPVPANNEFCNLHELEIQAIADEEVAVGMQGIDPIINGQLTHEEIERCEADPPIDSKWRNGHSATGRPPERPAIPPLSRRQGSRMRLRGFSPCPELSDAQIGRLPGTTKPTINAIRDRTHRNMPNLRPRSPVELGFAVMTI